MKDDTELDSMLLKSAQEDAALYVKEGAKPLRGAALESLAAQYMEVMAMTRRWARRYDGRVLEKMVYMPPLTPASFSDQDVLAKWAEQLEERVNAR